MTPKQNKKNEKQTKNKLKKKKEGVGWFTDILLGMKTSVDSNRGEGRKRKRRRKREETESTG